MKLINMSGSFKKKKHDWTTGDPLRTDEPSPARTLSSYIDFRQRKATIVRNHVQTKYVSVRVVF